MRRLFRACLLGLVLVNSGWPQPAEAVLYKQQIRLTGCRGFLAAKGMATYTDSFGETKTRDGQTLLIVVENVPLPPGTELTVYVHGNNVGTMTLDRQRNGRFLIESSFRKPAPPLNLGSFVVLKLPDDTSVIW